MRRWILAATAITCFGCQAEPEPLEVMTQALDPVPCAKTDNDLIRLKLAPNCAGCHGAGTSAPYFASAEAFEGLLVRNPKYIVPGDPDASELVRLLEGEGTGTYTQMPTAG